MRQKLLCNGAGCVALVAQKGEESELHLAFDITHDPWKTLAVRVLASMSHDLEQMGEDTEQFDQLIQLLTGSEENIQ